MLAIISFTLLGIWTSILGIINNFGHFSSNEPKQNLNISIKEEPILQQRDIQKSAPVQIRADVDKSCEISKAFQNLWNQIVHGK